MRTLTRRNDTAYIEDEGSWDAPSIELDAGDCATCTGTCTQDHTGDRQSD